MSKKITVIGLLLLIAGSASAYTVPVSGELAYTVYDIVMNKIIGGPIGYTAAGGLVTYGAYAFGTGAQGGTGTAIKAITAGGTIGALALIVGSLGAVYYL